MFSLNVCDGFSSIHIAARLLIAISYKLLFLLFYIHCTVLCAVQLPLLFLLFHCCF